MLITAAPSRIAVRTPLRRGRAGQRVGRQRDVERPGARPDAEDADVVLGRRGDRRRSRCRAGCRAGGRRACVVLAAGELGVGLVEPGVEQRDQRARRRDGGGARFGSATAARQAFGGFGERVVGDRLLVRAQRVRLRVEQQAAAAQRAGERARAPARDHVVAAADRAARRTRARPRARRRRGGRRRARSPGRRGSRRRTRRRGAASAPGRCSKPARGRRGRRRAARRPRRAAR